MTTKIDQFFSAQDRERIAEAVRTAETRTIGQIVPAVVERSDSYREVPFRAGIVAVMVANLGLLTVHHPMTLHWVMAIQIAAFVIGLLLSQLDAIARPLIGPARLHAAARARAERAFADHHLQLTPHATGVLIFASLFERVAVVLGDRGIDAKLGQSSWEETLAGLVRSIHAGKPAEGFVEAIGHCSKALAQHFPRTAGEANENSLPDALRVD